MSQKINQYEVLKTIQKNGENGNVFLVQNKEKEKFIIKQFNKAVQPCIGYGKETHFGRRREGSNTVYSEIKNISNNYKFLIDFHKRFKWENKWCILIEYIEGMTLGQYITQNKNDKQKTNNVVKKFAKEIALWHKNNFALGDPHLENVMVESETEKIKLIDYSQLHHPSFKYCIKYNCFTPRDKRMKQDLINQTGHFGKGFITELSNLEKRLQIDYNLAETFKAEYKE